MKKFLSILAIIMVSGVANSVLPKLHYKFLHNKKHSIVKVFYPEKGSGTGFIIKRGKYKYVLTNRHVCRINDGKEMKLKDYAGRTYKSRVLVFSKHYDLCLMTAPQKLPYLSMAKSYKELDDAYVLGHPLGLEISLEKGVLQNKEEIELAISCKLPHDRKIKIEGFMSLIMGKTEMCIKAFDSIRTNAIIHRGNSGSPILDIYGRVQGVAFAGSTRAENVGFIIPLEVVERFLNSIKYYK